MPLSLTCLVTTICLLVEQAALTDPTRIVLFVHYPSDLSYLILHSPDGVLEDSQPFRERFHVDGL